MEVKDLIQTRIKLLETLKIKANPFEINLIKGELRGLKFALELLLKEGK